MPNGNPHYQDRDREPSPNFPTDADSAIAAQLRKRLEKRYLSVPTALTTLAVAPGTDRSPSRSDADE